MPEPGENEDGRIDSSKREALLTARYQEEGEVRTEQDLWEEHQVAMATRRVGAQASVWHYCYVFEV
jgi:hypothetical protein